MKMDITSIMSKLAIACTLLAIAFSASAQSGKGKPRNAEWEATFMILQQGSEQIGGPGDAQVDFDSDIGWGFTIGYNFNQHLNLAMEFNYVETDYTVQFTDADGDSRRFKNESDFSNLNLNLSYYFLNGPVQPFIMGTVGSTYTDSNISDGNGYCVPSYYWGWYCYDSSYDASNWSYGAAAGIRVDLDRKTFLRASYGLQWVDFDGKGSDPEFDIFRLEIGRRL